MCQNNDNFASRRCLITGGMSVLLRLVLLVSLASVLLMANEQQQVPSCCESESEKLSQSQVKALVKKTEPIHPPCCADMLHISGTIVLAISVDPQGNVACVQVVSGDPLIIGVAIDSVRQWKFEPYNSKGIKKVFCGQVALRIQANEHAVKYKII
jgi:outer membrane biosynthesis protein TonB